MKKANHLKAWLALLACAGCQNGQNPQLNLPLSQIPGRFEPILLAPVAPLARYENFPFFTSDCTMTANDGSGNLIAGLPLRSRFSFYLNARRPLQLEFRARFTANLVQPVTLLVNGQPWLSCALSQEWTTYRQSLPEAALRLGRNQLSMTMELGQGVEFQKLEITPLSSAPATPLGSQELQLPWEANLALALEAQGASQLHFEELAGDTAAGAAPPKNAFLRVSLRAPDQEWQQDYPVHPGPLDIALPASSSGWSKLQLMAISPGRPLPGQRGLRAKQGSIRLTRYAAPASQAGTTAPGPPSHCNVIIYLIDTLRADHLGCYGYSPSPSPCLDAFAKDAVLFADVSAQSGWTKPATASILSSQWPWKHRVQDFADKVPPELPWLPQILQKAGYHTAAVCTNNLAGPDFGYDRGYESFQIMPKGTSEQAQAATARWLEKNGAGQQPFFLYVHTIDPHSPYMHSARYRGQDRAAAEPLDTEPRALTEEAFIKKLRGESLLELKPRVDQLLADYDREIANNDRNFGLLIRWLKEHGLYDQTLIVVVSDHGEEFLEHGHVGHLNSLYQELLHVPLLIKFPGHVQGGARIAETWQQIDIAPTILQACGLPAPPAFQGQAFQPGATPPPARLSLFSVQAGRVVLPAQQQDRNPIFTSAHGIRQGNWMYQRVLAGAAGQCEPEELYDLANDPTQQHNLAQTDPGRGLSLSLLLEPLFQLTAQELPKDDESNRKLLELLRSLQYVR